MAVVSIFLLLQNSLYLITQQIYAIDKRRKRVTLQMVYLIIQTA
jgi:hypothetical protein